MDYNISADNLFSELLVDTEKQFKESPIYQKQLTLGKQWNYSICATPISKGNGVLFGINWGGAGNFQSQTIMPSGQGIIGDHFIKQSRQFLEKQWGLDFVSINFNYANLCFFRTPREKYLSLDDYKLSLPLFEKYIRYIDPIWILSIGVTNLKVLKALGAIEKVQPHFDKQNKFKGYSGRLWEWNIFSVPHPSAHLTNEARQTIWESVTSEMKRATNR